ncbi:hypothetical protein HAX54_041013, partial [Datura stramonium]|nr:hypothetical protein [Datura stramonium]
DCGLMKKGISHDPPNIKMQGNPQLQSFRSVLAKYLVPMQEGTYNTMIEMDSGVSCCNGCSRGNYASKSPWKDGFNTSTNNDYEHGLYE